jgi:hypothetical protein
MRVGLPFVAVAFILFAAKFVKSFNQTSTVSDELLNVVSVTGIAGGHYYPPHGVQDDTSLSSSTTTIGYSSSARDWDDNMEPRDLLPHYYPRTYLE